jgi:hypothetical protein
MKKILLFFSLVFLSSYFIIWKWYGLDINYPTNKKFKYQFELTNQETSHQNALYVSLKGSLGITFLENDQGIILEFDQVKGLYGTGASENKFKEFLNRQIKKPILIKESPGGFLEILYPKYKGKGEQAEKLFAQIIYYLTIPFPREMEMLHHGPFGKGHLTYKKRDKDFNFDIEKKSAFNGAGTFKVIFTPSGYLQKISGTDEDFQRDGDKVLSKSKMEFSFELVSISNNQQVNLEKIIQNSITFEK